MEIKLKRIDDRYVDHCYIYLTTSEPIAFGKFDQTLVVHEEEPCRLDYRIYGDILIDAGFWYEDLMLRPEHGGYWSGAGSTIGPYLGMELVDVNVNNRILYMKREALKAMLPEGFNVYRREINGRIRYHVGRG